MAVTWYTLGTVRSLVRVGDIHTAPVIHLLSRARLQAVSFEKSSTVVGLVVSLKYYLISVTLQGDSALSYQVKHRTKSIVHDLS
jgi:hypothetical protein